MLLEQNFQNVLSKYVADDAAFIRTKGQFLGNRSFPFAYTSFAFQSIKVSIYVAKKKINRIKMKQNDT